MKSKFLTTVVAVGSLAAIGAAGCGGDDALTEEEFLTQGNDICAAGNEEIDAAGEEAFGSGQPSEEDLDAFVTDTLVPSIQGQIDDIGELEPPEDLADQVDTFLSDAQSALDALEDDPSSVAEGDPFADVNAQATEIGLVECADG